MTGPWDLSSRGDQAGPSSAEARFARWKAEKGIVEDADGNLVSRDLVRSLQMSAAFSLFAALIGSVVSIWAVRVSAPGNAQLREVALIGLLVLGANAAFHLWRHGRRTTRAVIANRRTGFTSSFAAILSVDILALLIPLAAAGYIA